MKGREFLKAAVCILGFLLLNQVVSSLFVHWSRGFFDYELNGREFEAVQEQVSVVILGDSHPMAGVVAGDIDGGYNFSSAAESCILTYYKLKYYLEAGKFHPQVALLPVDLHTFLSVRLERIDVHDPAFWIRYMDYFELGRETNTLDEQIKPMLSGRFPLIGGLDVTIDVIWPEETPQNLPMVSGFTAWVDDFSAVPVKERKMQARNLVESYFPEANNYDRYLLDYFYRLLDLLDEYNVQVVFIWYPITEEYYQYAGQYVMTEAHLAKIRELLADRSPALILDYHDLFFGHPEYFADSNHLNGHGAEFFTNLLVEDLTREGLLPIGKEFE